MARITLSRSDLYPVGTTVSVFAGSNVPDSGSPAGTAITTGVVDAAGNLSIDHASILPLTSYILWATGAPSVKVRSQLDVFDTGGGIGTGDTATSVTVSNAGISLPTGGGAVTGTAATDLFSRTGHGFVANDAVRFTGLTGGAGITPGKTYYVIAAGLTANVFAVSATLGGATIDFTTDLTAGTVSRAVPFQIGQAITGPGIPPGVTITNVVGDTLTLSAPTTATASGVAITAYGARAWSAIVKRRRVAIGTL
jgi:hypothetical protein